MDSQLKMVWKSEKPRAFVSIRINLEYLMTMIPPNKVYLPPQGQDTTFYVDTMSIVMHKDFAYIKEIDNS